MNLRPTQIGVLAATAVVFLSSLLFVFYSVDDFGAASASEIKEECEDLDRSDFSGAERDAVDFTCDLAEDGGVKAWNTDLFAPLSTWPALLAAGGLVLAGLAYFKGASPSVLGFSTSQLLTALGLAASIIMAGWLIEGGQDGFELGTGFWLMLLGSIGWTVASVLDAKAESGPGAGPGMPGAPGQAPPSPF